MPTIRLTGQLRRVLGAAELRSEAADLRGALEEVRTRLGDRASEVFEGAGELKRPYVAAVNGKVVPREEYAQTALKPEDEVSIVGALAGG